ncbi:hypothetical protein GBA65_21730 (plasmid) [Rubrobacter marinus]|uniref:Uncharacterized protein n=1 Tax=Rubrobacter marinus TaxID=2653852 RepID=A0A6G8Q3K4_9ACTN|nr:hypothetical protein [Rubrobacter marinus]QIN81061.1 hypothetical protein GBA65_21730 [Rubrobacter marinus]
MTHENEKTLATYDVVSAGSGRGESWPPLRWVVGGLLGGGVKSMTATDRRLVVDYGRDGQASFYYAPGMTVYCRRACPPGFARRLLFRTLCLASAMVLVLEGYPVSLFAALPLALLAVAVFRSAFVVRVEVDLPVPDKLDTSIVRARFVAAGPRRRRLQDFVERLNLAVADHNPPTPSSASGSDGPEGRPPLRPCGRARAGGGPVDPRSGGGPVDPRSLQEEVPPDVAPRDLSPRHLLAGVLAIGDPEDYEGALLDGLEHETRKLAFSPSPTNDPCRVAGDDLPGMDPAATACVFGGPEDAPGRDPRAGIFGAFVLDVPESFPHRRYVASYAATAEEGDARGGSGSRRAGPAAISAWLSEAPLRSADGEGLLTRWVPWVLVAARALRDDPQGPVRAWLRAFPGLGPYERRVRARWRLQPAGCYRVRMNFHEDVESEDFYAYHGGLRDAYPPSLAWGRAPGSTEGVDLLTGDVTFSVFREACALAGRMEGEFAERGVLCAPRVELADPRGYPFELRDNRWPWSSRPITPSWARHEEGHGLAALLSPPDGAGVAHVPLAGLAATLPSREVAEHMLLRADGFARTTNRMARLSRRLADGRIPGVRKDVLAMQLDEERLRHDETLRALTDDPAALVALLASVERERELLRGVLHHVDREDRRDLDSFEIRWRLGELERLRGASAEEDHDD